ncbi:MAG: hypothetical protein U1F48_11165 [Burkholderiales bacterium]
MRRRLIAWIALFATLVGLAAPAHAYGHRDAPGGAAPDFCTTKATPAAPAAPPSSDVAGCDACANCMPSAGPSASLREPVIPAAGVHAAPATARDAGVPPDAPFEARAPPPLR